MVACGRDVEAQGAGAAQRAVPPGTSSAQYKSPMSSSLCGLFEVHVMLATMSSTTPSKGPKVRPLPPQPGPRVLQMAASPSAESGMTWNWGTGRAGSSS